MNTTYVDGFVIPVPTANLERYREVAEVAATVWLDHGALDYRECTGDALEAQNMVSFTDLAKAGPDETVVFAWISYASKEDRDRINALVMQDPRMEAMCGGENMPFDCTRMAYGGFRTLVSRTASPASVG